jgi:hypothetical protein
LSDASKKFTLGFHHHAIQVTDIYNTLSQALESPGRHKPQILLIQCNSLHAGVQVDIHRLAEIHGALQVIVLYSFGQEPIIAAMKRCGMIVRRDPISDADLADLVNSAKVAGYRASAGRIGLVVDNFLTVFFFNDFKAQAAKSWKSYVFIDFRRAFALFECPAIARVKSALQTLISASSTQSARARQTKRYRAL